MVGRRVRSRKRNRQCERAMAHARDYYTWREAALELDTLEGKDDWKEIDVSPDYNYRLIRDRLNRLRELRKSNNIRELVFFLHEGLHGNMGNIASPSLYQHTRVGTKRVIKEYLDETTLVLQHICDSEFPDFPIEEKIRFFKRIGKVYGRSSLMLSGGATLGMFHIGVIKALWNQDLLPRVISGSSAGSIIAGVVGCHTDDELENFIDPYYLYTQAFRMASPEDAWRRRALMDGEYLEQCLRQNMGDMTFEEAFDRTGRIINITISPVHVHQQPRLCNYLTSPTVLLRRASRASCGVPGLFPPVALQAKDFDGNIVPYLPSLRWSDGSLKSDLPMKRLARLHDVNHFIVSQTNPHIVPFLTAEKRRRRKGILSFLRHFGGSTYKVVGAGLLDAARNNVESEFLRRPLDEAYAVATQQYKGDITIMPSLTFRNYMEVLANPTPRDLARFMLSGERCTWPQLERIRNNTVVSRAIDGCIEKLKIRTNQQPAGPNTSTGRAVSRTNTAQPPGEKNLRLVK